MMVSTQRQEPKVTARVSKIEHEEEEVHLAELAQHSWKPWLLFNFQLPTQRLPNFRGAVELLGKRVVPLISIRYTNI